ncbi:phosphodiester glycosidase family protein [Micromonospora deserti]|uniref:phosphodiester glycosidase family protein n=1 Tax=Micromonospora deserti TaxID=2070366 RepID=UPI0018F4E169|nr:phosphodiester glycosidase family protein [Micromonospora deserti]
MAAGVTLTRIERGTEPAPADQINTTTRGPCVVNVLTIDHAVNLDGGGSTAMAVEGALVNRPSGSTERAVGDALVYVDGPYRSGN